MIIPGTFGTADYITDNCENLCRIIIHRLTIFSWVRRSSGQVHESDPWAEYVAPSDERQHILSMSYKRGKPLGWP
jgi:hypothetical protein